MLGWWIPMTSIYWNHIISMSNKIGEGVGIRLSGGQDVGLVCAVCTHMLHASLSLWPMAMPYQGSQPLMNAMLLLGVPVPCLLRLRGPLACARRAGLDLERVVDNVLCFSRVRTPLFDHQTHDIHWICKIPSASSTPRAGQISGRL